MRIAALTLIIFATQGFGQGPPVARAVFTDSALSFRYTPPPHLRDLTEFDRQSIQRNATAMGKANTLTLLLSLRSGPDDAATDWHTIGIESYPREKLTGFSERDACRMFSRWVAGVGPDIGQPEDVQLGDTHFVISNFELHQGQLIKRVRVYTTIRKGRMLSFGFSANSPDVLNRIVNSMATFQNWKR